MNFNSHAHVERDMKQRCHMVTNRSFQLTRSRGAWPYYTFSKTLAINFNSHAHVERDVGKIITYVTIWISTHTLTWSVTFDMCVKIFHNSISTHTLTWSVTWWYVLQISQKIHFNSHAHVERDISAPDTAVTVWHFNSHAHVERDTRQNVVQIYLKISTHTLTWSVTW